MVKNIIQDGKTGVVVEKETVEGFAPEYFLHLGNPNIDKIVCSKEELLAFQKLIAEILEN